MRDGHNEPLTASLMSLVGQGKAKEDGLVKQIKSVLPNKVATITANLEAGSYVILCNVSGHYQLGMRAAFKVE